MSILKAFACFVVALTAVGTVTAESHCPGNVASVPYHLVNRHQMVIDVSVNHRGPYSFLLDTGTQITMVDPDLARELALEKSGEAAVASAGASGSGWFARLDPVEAGQNQVASLKVLVYDLTNLQAAGMKIRGVLGEDYLEHFDMLIDNAHQEVCLADPGGLRGAVKGERIPLLPGAPTADATLPQSLIVSVRLSDGMRPVRLKLDSGANVSFLYNTSEFMALGAFRGASLQGGANGSRQSFMALPLQNLKIGRSEVARVPFVTLTGVQKNTRTSDFDGLLSLGLFRRVFVDHEDHVVILEPM